MTENQRRRWIIAGALLLALILWMNRYHYTKTYNNLPVRINRFTGHAQVLSGTRWVEDR